MNSFEHFFLDFGFSWTLSKYIPYLLAVILGWLLAMVIIRLLLKNKKKWVRLIVIISSCLALFFVYFAISPIYIGDIINGGENEEYNQEATEFTNNNLVVIGIPGCRYCTESFEITNAIQERNPNASITFVLSYGEPSDIDYYRKLADSRVNIILSKNEEALLPISKGIYPTYSILQNDNYKSWSNNTIGVLALDEIENHIK